MNYQKIYKNLVNNARSQNRVKLNKDNPQYIYYENHHILPKCLGGSNEKENLVLLTSKEHFICHKLLTFIYPNNMSIARAFHFLVHGNNSYNKSGRDYQYVRELLSMTKLSKKTRDLYDSNEFKLKMSIITSGKNNGMYGKTHSKESIEKIKEKRKFQINPMQGKKHSDESKKKMSATKIQNASVKGSKNPMYGVHRYGKRNPMYGKTMSEEGKEKIRESNRRRAKNNK
jgi:hypothetical protein